MLITSPLPYSFKGSGLPTLPLAASSETTLATYSMQSVSSNTWSRYQRHIDGFVEGCSGVITGFIDNTTIYVDARIASMRSSISMQTPISSSKRALASAYSSSRENPDDRAIKHAARAGELNAEALELGALEPDSMGLLTAMVKDAYEVAGAAWWIIAWRMDRARTGANSRWRYVCAFYINPVGASGCSHHQ